MAGNEIVIDVRTVLVYSASGSSEPVGTLIIKTIQR